jgi:hypothetical protein
MTPTLKQIFSLFSNGKFEETAQAIKGLVSSNADICSQHVTLANMIMLGAGWQYVNKLLPPKTNFFFESGWLQSLISSRPVNQNGDAIPWFTYPCIDFLDGLNKTNWTVFEWGSGNSTVWWSKHVKQVVAVEDNEEWFAEVKKQISTNVDYSCCKDDSYYKRIKQFPDNYFDVIVIDGSYRNECAIESINKISKEGLIIFDNADGVDFKKAQILFMEKEFYRIDFWGLIPSYAYKNCTSIFSKSPAIFKPQSLQMDLSSSTGISCFQAIDRARLSNR